MDTALEMGVRRYVSKRRRKHGGVYDDLSIHTILYLQPHQGHLGFLKP